MRVKVPACVSWAFIATSFTKVIYIHIYTCYMQHFFSQQEPPLWCSWSSFVCSSWDARRDYPFHHICSKSCNETLAETYWWWYSEELDGMSSPVSIVTTCYKPIMYGIYPLDPDLPGFLGSLFWMTVSPKLQWDVAFFVQGSTLGPFPKWNARSSCAFVKSTCWLLNST